MDTPLSAAERMIQAVIDRDLDVVLDSFSGAPDAYVFPEGPRWTTRGGDRIEQGWRAYFQAPVGIGAFHWVEGPHVFENATLGQVTGVIDYEVLGNGESGRLRMRMTWLMRLEGDRWRVVHEHGSQPLADPYGAGDWWPEGARPLDAPR
ncbi:YybH family protein [Spirillospora sp. NBC_01491]|uniref:YybH family protein n=1 Tax=Spirillospora sp. NBC_01491 TaxID=2976007 RepID=UPI002E31E7F8|nr:nuclear transport factor 2 family protein [Spirillospora sp. NBC_01491]